ncbi:unnamed protein product [Vitrella brassicaformis CCMP3155]|uniref:Uncharacterized protein n=1 Tax=Vitrella brassicaformis (strain CCMP3155) TaxID=1169540 RepID=A0A0G4GK76_VITBC|nr:unnamed protein product [Vitrella brassicaformis CCMP3155]|eukprot:CEM30302.1 unnamed protein product [Vitrella brassicaformis CCMP3155]
MRSTVMLSLTLLLVSCVTAQEFLFTEPDAPLHKTKERLKSLAAKSVFEDDAALGHARGLQDVNDTTSNTTSGDFETVFNTPADDGFEATPPKDFSISGCWSRSDLEDAAFEVNQVHGHKYFFVGGESGVLQGDKVMFRGQVGTITASADGERATQIDFETHSWVYVSEQCEINV